MKNLINKLISCGIEESEAKTEISILEKEVSDKGKIKQIVEERIKTRKPIQYILGKAYFMDFIVMVNEKVLIPRSETEILVGETIKRCRDMPRHVSTTALDIGTGSGIIPIALCKAIPNIEVTAIDIDEDVINLAKENARTNKVIERISFKQYDLFADKIEKLFSTNKFDLVISNPPYIKDKEFVNLEPEIHLHEPKIAHCGSKENKTGLVYYERIIELCCSDLQLRAPRLIALEIDPPIVDDLKSLLIKNKLNDFEIVKDYLKLERCLFVYFSKFPASL